MIKQFFDGRPHWINLVLVFCGYMTFIYMPYDMFIKSVADDREVWFGFMLSGWYAKATEPLHWAIYGAGFYGFLKMKSWLWPWASLYVFQIAIGMMVWVVLNDKIHWYLGVIPGTLFTVLAVALWRAKPLYDGLTVRANNEQSPGSSDNPA